MPSIMDESRPHGVIAASCTPLTEEERPDAARLASHIHRLQDLGCDFVLLFGTTGEGMSFTVDERRETLDAVVEHGVRPESLLIGTGACPLPDTVALTRHATEHGVAGCLVLPPFHFPVISDDGVFTWYDRLIREVEDDRLRVFLYHFPDLTGVNISFPVIQHLVDAHGDKVAGVKDSSREWDHMQVLCRSFPDLRIFAGTERYLAPILGENGAGCISATVNVTAPLARAVYDALKRGENVGDAQDRLTNLRMDIGQYPVITAVKCLLAEQTGDAGWKRSRPPVAEPSEQMRQNLAGVLERLAKLDRTRTDA